MNKPQVPQVDQATSAQLAPEPKAVANESFDYDTLMQAHLTRVFGERDGDRRLGALRELYVDDASLIEPNGVVTGYVAISKAVDALQASMPPEFGFTAVGAAVGHNGVGRLQWLAGPPGGPAAVTGTDVAHVENGRIKSLHVFVDPLPRGTEPRPSVEKKGARRIGAVRSFGREGLDALLTPEDSVLLLMDHQPFQFAGLNSHEPTMVINNVVGLAKTAKAFGVPTILTTVLEERGGYLIKGLRDVFPGQKPINRTFINTWQDERVVAEVKKTGRKKIVMAGLWTEICVAMPALQAVSEGYEVYVVTDACGGVSREAHDMAVRRMAAAGVVPITWQVTMGEWQRDWARQETLSGLAGVMTDHSGATGVAFSWEIQLLGGEHAPGQSASEHDATRSKAPQPAAV